MLRPHLLHPMTLADQVAATLRQRVRLASGARVLVALSGGADSVALACLMADLQRRGDWSLAGLAHVNHQLRGAEADGDEAFSAEVARQLGVPFRSTRRDVTALAAERHESIEAAARRARYAWLSQVAGELGATHIATGHTMDDQAETVLLRLLRGAGTRGLSGVRATRGTIIRPLLECRRVQLREFLAQRGQPFREDASNTDRTIARNRIRHELLPVVETIGPGAVAALARTATLAADDERFLSGQATHLMRTHVSFDVHGAEIPRVALRTMPPSIARRVLRQSIEQVAPAEALRLTSRHLEAVMRAVRDADTRHVDLPGVWVDVSAAVLRLGHIEHGSVAMSAGEAFDYELPVPGTVQIIQAGWTISAVRRDQTVAAGVESREALSIAVPWQLLDGRLRVRNRWPGDRIKPIGAVGRKKLQDLMVDLKIPRAARDRVPVVVDASGRVVWVVGVAMADEFRVTAPEAEVVVFTAERQ